MLSRYKNFAKLSLEERRLFWEAYRTLGVMRLLIMTVSFKRLTRSLDQVAQKRDIPPLSIDERDIAGRVGAAIGRASAHTPWESACLVQSLTARQMLQKREIPGVFYIGVAKDQESEAKIRAHAWSQCGEKIITGGKGHENFTVLSVFGWGCKAL